MNLLTFFELFPYFFVVVPHTKCKSRLVFLIFSLLSIKYVLQVIVVFIAASSSPDILHAPELERQYVHEVYDTIAESFSDSRYAPWPGVMRFLRSLPSGSWGADIGCGNGKYLVAVVRDKLPLSPLLASDSSLRLLDHVRGRGFDGVAANLLALPYRPGLLDFFISVAVLHHLATPQRRLEGLKSMASLLRVGGLGLIQVWAKDQHWKGQTMAYVQSRKPDCAKGIVMTNAAVPGGGVMPVQKSRAPFVAADILLPWNASKKKAETATEVAVMRYYHVFEASELENLIAEVSCLELVESVYEQGNWSTIVRKIDPTLQDSNG
ncbi:Alkylated DNA repair protein AlkB [Echinococcus granulosus]|uniref:Alkylated DNA repair protein AlkB n=1 Tax=Echinococcus granulosus TaxID=6210 RepID=W6V171_ECHGR|nr:Alkylated DNA repair protein AlkB [Echinococcus granulosus]EUB59584.1 Alkylated DNA repair protein AlkB [Echinococcus granulosus]